MTLAVKPQVLKYQAKMLMQQLGMDNIMIHLFYDQNIVFMFEHDIACQTTLLSTVSDKLKELERDNGYVVYAVIYSDTEYGQMYSFLLVSKYAEDFDKLIIPQGNGKFLVYAYVWNVDHDDYSESGYVLIDSKNGMLRRLG